MNNKKGSVTLYIVFIIIALTIVFIAAIASPMSIAITSKFYLAGEKLMIDSNETLSQIQNESVRDAITNNMDNALANTEDNITILTAIYQYGWIFVLFVTAIGMFLFGRTIVEFGGGFI